MIPQIIIAGFLTIAAFFIGTHQHNLLGATILTTNSSDTLNTGRTNTNTSLINLNNQLNSLFSFTPTSWGVSTSTTVGFTNGFLSNASSTISASTTISGVLTASGGIYGALTGNVTGNSSTATSLAANGANCSAGNYPLGVDASGAVESCTAVSASGSTVTTGYATTSPVYLTFTEVAGDVFMVWAEKTASDCLNSSFTIDPTYRQDTEVASTTGFSGPNAGNSASDSCTGTGFFLFTATTTSNIHFGLATQSNSPKLMVQKIH